MTAAFCTVQMAMQRGAIDLRSTVCAVRDLTWIRRVDPVPGVIVLRGPGSVHGIDSLAGGHPFHQAIELRQDIIDCRFLEIVRGRPVHNRTGLHAVVDRGAPNRQRHTDDESEDKSHCRYSLVALHDASAAAGATRRCKPVTRKKFSVAQS